MHQDRDTGQSTPAEHTPGNGVENRLSQTPDSQPVQANEPRFLALNKPVTRDSLIEQHGLDPNDPEVSSLLDRILDLRDVARIKSFLPVIAARHIAAFRSGQQNGNEISPQQELQNP